MNEKKPQVFPSAEQLREANAVGTQLALNQETGIANANPNQIHDPIAQTQPGDMEQAAAIEMRRRTQEQMELRNHAEKMTREVKDEATLAREALLKQHGGQPQVQPQVQLGEQPTIQPSIQPTPVENMQSGAMSYDQMAEMQNYIDQVADKAAKNPVPKNPDGSTYYGDTGYQPPTPPNTPSNVGRPSDMNPAQPDMEAYIQELSKPQFDAPFDVIPLPSEGRTYGNGKKSIKVAYMTTADENILTSPNLLTSGRFLEILINRKILEPELRYEDLLEGDRNAIMLWLRATGYGNMYPITVPDENGKEFETEVDLNEIKTVNFTVNPDDHGEFAFKLPLSGKEIKFKLLSVGQVDKLDSIIKNEVEVLMLPINNTNTYTLQNQIVSIDGNRDGENIIKFVDNMRIGDSTALRNYIESMNCGVDMTITVGTPGGGSIETFLPLNLKFFWPNF